VIIAVALTHWPRLTRILRAEILQVLTSDYIAASRHFGKSWGFIAHRHLIPHVVPQLLVGFLLLFPHAILHEAGLTFLGFGLEPSKPAIGVLLSESMRYLTAGYWWLGLFPGLALVIVVLAFDGLADGVRALFTPRAAQD
jgi:peptide/nickel transport system permease protein